MEIPLPFWQTYSSVWNSFIQAFQNEILHDDIIFFFSSLHTLQKIPESRFFCASQSQISENRPMPLVFNVFWFWGANIIASFSFVYFTPLKQVSTNDLSIPIIWTILTAFIWFSCAKFLPFNENFHFFLLVTSTYKQQKKMYFLHPFGHCFDLFLRFWFDLHFLHWCLPIPFLIFLFLSPTQKTRSFFAFLWGAMCLK